ncbi:MAG: hypothetical protein ACK5PQ_05165 [Alphaproteobacteria bacterium]
MTRLYPFFITLCVLISSGWSSLSPLSDDIFSIPLYPIMDGVQEAAHLYTSQVVGGWQSELRACKDPHSQTQLLQDIITQAHTDLQIITNSNSPKKFTFPWNAFNPIHAAILKRQMPQGDAGPLEPFYETLGISQNSLTTEDTATLSNHIFPKLYNSIFQAIFSRLQRVHKLEKLASSAWVGDLSFQNTGDVLDPEKTWAENRSALAKALREVIPQTHRLKAQLWNDDTQLVSASALQDQLDHIFIKFPSRPPTPSEKSTQNSISGMVETLDTHLLTYKKLVADWYNLAPGRTSVGKDQGEQMDHSFPPPTVGQGSVLSTLFRPQFV